jgi:hypothetical protein
MKTIFAVSGILLLAATFIGTGRTAAAESRVIHRNGIWRVAPQDCFLTPDVAVAIHALGPYCSSPRGVSREGYSRRYHWPEAIPTYYVPYYGYYRPWGWSDVNTRWGW